MVSRGAEECTGIAKRRPPGGGLHVCVCAALMLGFASAAWAQQRLRFGPDLNAHKVLREVNPYAAVIQPSEEATTLLRRAGEGIERKDWKLVIDSLQRIVELPGEHVLTSDGKLYESARRHAHRRIAALPRPGLEAYRLVHDGEAASLLKRGIEEHDPTLLQIVVDRFLCTSVGDVAAFTLADWLLDEGRFSEAAGLLQSTFGANGRGGIYPDSRLPAWAVPSRLAICAAALGQRQRAESLLKAAATQPASTQPEQAGPDARMTDGDVAARRLAAVEAFVASQPSDLAVDVARESAPWRCAMGRWSRDGQQSEVEPALDEHDGLKITLSSDTGLPPDAVSEYARREGLMPVRQVVTDGHVLVVRRDDDLLALDVDSFSVRWQSRKKREEATPSPADQFRQVPQNFPGGDARSSSDAQMRSNPAVVRMLHDSVAGSMSIAEDMVLVVEWLGDGPRLSEQTGRRIGFPGRDPFTATHANRIVAYSLRDGSFLWKSDASTTRQVSIQGTGPAETEFLAAPVYIDGALVAPCRMNSDLFAVVLDPQTGRMVRQIYLCGTGGGPFDSLAALEPCLVDGVIFFPTGRELLAALDTVNWSVRWAVRYPATRDGQSVRGWRPGPPVAVSDVVLLAPTDADVLLCFDRSSGALRWQADRERFTHIIAASDQGVWVGGTGVARLDLETGRPVWSRNTPPMSGRGALAGDRLYIPTFEGLLAMDARDGREITIESTVPPLVLGNLVAWEGSLYSVGMFQFERYPDLGRGYERALARHREDPTNPSRALRLASLERLRRKPQQALAALEHIPADLKETNPPQYESVVHVRVRAMLDCVSSGVVKGDAALAMLKEARAIALSEADALACIDELGKFLTRNNRPLEAALQYLSLIVSREGDLVVSADGDQIVSTGKGDGLHRRARGMAVERILDLLKDLSVEQARELQARMEAFVAEAAEKRNAEGLLWLAESTGLGEVAHRAEVLLGTWAAEELRFEQAEGYFQRALQGAKEKLTQAEAAARLAAMYLESEELHQPASAARWLERLQREWGDVLLPRSILDPASEVSTQPAGQSQSRLPGREIAAALAARIDRPLLRTHQAAMQPAALGQAGQPSVQLHPLARPLIFRGQRTEPLADRMMLYLEGGRVEAHPLDEGRRLWPAELRLIGDLAVEPRQQEWQTVSSSARSDALGPARGVLSGQTMIVNTDYGIHAIGLRTGRRLWSRPFEPPELPGDPAASDACIWTHDGYVMSVDRYGHLEVAYANQGDRVLWRSSMQQRKWAAVRARGPYVVTVNAALEHGDIFRLSDGRYIGEFSFEQDVSPSRKINLTLFDDVICGPAVVNEIKALELATPGVERWRETMPAAIAQIFKPTPDLLAIADRTGLLRLVDPATGRRRLEVRVKSCGQGVDGGAIVDGVLYVYGYQFRATDTSERDKQRYGLAAINMASGEIIWEVRELPARTFLSDDLLRASPNAIPLASFMPAGVRSVHLQGRGEGVGPAVGAVELEIISKRTGKPIGERIRTTMERDTGASQIQAVEVWPGHILVVSGSSYLRYPVERSVAQKDAANPSEHALAHAGTQRRAFEHASAPDGGILIGGKGLRAVPAEVIATVIRQHADELKNADREEAPRLLRVWAAEEMERRRRERDQQSDRQEAQGGLR